MMQELEVPHQRKLQAVEAEVDKYRQQYFDLQRQHEQLRVEYEQFAIDHVWLPCVSR